MHAHAHRIEAPVRQLALFGALQAGRQLSGLHGSCRQGGRAVLLLHALRPLRCCARCHAWPLHCTDYMHLLLLLLLLARSSNGVHLLLLLL